MQKNKEPNRIDVYGLRFSNINQSKTLSKILNNDFTIPKYICFPSTNLVSKAYFNKKLQRIFNDAWLTLPDGQGTEFYARFKGFKKLGMTSGYTLMNQLLDTGLTHYFYGVDNITLENMIKNIKKKYPKSKVIGYKSPPIFDIDEIDSNNIIKNDIEIINNLKPDIIWIGVSNVKQDYLMDKYYKELNHGLMIGVGAVFIYMAGKIDRGPDWIKKLALRWVLRIFQQPSEGYKTLPSTIFFILLFLKEIMLMPFKYLLKLIK